MENERNSHEQPPHQKDRSQKSSQTNAADIWNQWKDSDEDQSGSESSSSDGGDLGDHAQNSKLNRPFFLKKPSQAKSKLINDESKRDDSDEDESDIKSSSSDEGDLGDHAQTSALNTRLFSKKRKAREAKVKEGPDSKTFNS